MYCMAGRQWAYKGRHKKELILDIMHIDLRLMVVPSIEFSNRILRELNNIKDFLNKSFTSGFRGT